MTYGFVVKPLTHRATLLGDDFGNKTIYKITLDFIGFFSINSMSQHGSAPTTFSPQQNFPRGNCTDSQSL